MIEKSSRILRVEKEILQVLSQELSIRARWFTDSIVTLSKVHVSPDLRNAKLYVSVFGEDDVDLILDELQKTKKDLQNLLAKKCSMKFTPKLKIFLDDCYEQNFEVLRKLNELDLAQEGN